MLRTGVVGLGVISKTHLEAIERLGDLAKLCAVCDCETKKGRNLQVPFYTDLEEMLKREKLDCLHICLPHNLHVPAARLAAKYGVHVFLEKPAGLTSKEIEGLEKDVFAQKIHIGVCLQNRYNETTKKALQAIREKTYGELKGCKVIVTWDRRENYYNRDLWRGKLEQAGGGVMLSQAIHSIDLMGVFCGKPAWVKGMAGNLLLEEIQVEDTACAHIQFQNGTGGIFYGSVTHCNNSSVEIELVMEKGCLCIKNNKLIHLLNHKETVLAADRVSEEGKEYYGSSHYLAIREFYRLLLGEGGSLVDLAEAKKVSLLIEKIMKSGKEGRRISWTETSV